MKKTILKWVWSAIFMITVSTLMQAEMLTGTEWDGNMKDLDPQFREHLQTVLKVIADTEDGQFILQHVSKELQFRTRPMVQLGVADGRNVITLEQLRLENSAIPDSSAAHDPVKICYTAEILAHELLHNAQFQEGLFQYPEGFSGREALICEKLLEMEAKLTGERMYDTVSGKEGFKRLVPPKSGLYLVMKRQSKEPEKEYLETLWGNYRSGTLGTKLYSGQIREIEYWNQAYAEQGFRNNYGRFLQDWKGKGDKVLVQHLEKIIRFRKLPVTAEKLLQTVPDQAIPHGIVGFQGSVKRFELTAEPGCYVYRKYQGKIVQENRIAVQR